MSGLRFALLALFALFLPDAVLAGEKFESPHAFAEDLRQIIISGDRTRFIEAHMDNEKISHNDKHNRAFLRYVFERGADGKSIQT
ncbi:MAG: hypothetical protein O2985_02355 [Proteobacteria bacterium]|nr:hypothetical protein [Pseudomonadota bacterium]